MFHVEDDFHRRKPENLPETTGAAEPRHEETRPTSRHKEAGSSQGTVNSQGHAIAKGVLGHAEGLQVRERDHDPEVPALPEDDPGSRHPMLGQGRGDPEDKERSNQEGRQPHEIGGWQGRDEGEDNHEECQENAKGYGSAVEERAPVWEDEFPLHGGSWSPLLLDKDAVHRGPPFPQEVRPRTRSLSRASGLGSPTGAPARRTRTRVI